MKKIKYCILAMMD